MSTVYNGNPGNIHVSIGKTISNIAPQSGVGSPLLVTTSTAHGYSENDAITIGAVTSTLNPNPNTTGTAFWTIHIVSATQYTLVGTSYVSGSYTSGGTSFDRSLSPSGTFVSDGESGTAAVMLALIGNLYDRTQFLWEAVRFGTQASPWIDGVNGGGYQPISAVSISLLECPSAGTWGIDVGGTFQVNGTIAFNSGSIITVATTTFEYLIGSTLRIDTSATLRLDRGLDCKIEDSTDPSYVNSRDVNICQPLIQLGGGTFVGAVAPDSIADGNTGTALSAYVGLTALSNGATLERLSVHVACASPHTPGIAAQLVLYKTNLNTGARTTIASANITVLNSSNTGVATLGSLSEVIDTSTNNYMLEYVSESSTGAQSFTWGAPIAEFGNITSITQRQG